MYTYILLHVFTVLFPLSYSFDSKISFYKKWKYLFPGIAAVALFFIVWDFLFTAWGVWFFNPAYLIGAYLGDLPVEEILFFFTVPFSCMFIYEALHYYIKRDVLRNYSVAITMALLAVLVFAAVMYHDRLYTCVTSVLAACMLVVHYCVFGNALLGRFYITYLVHLIPFFIVNGILTSLPVVSYNNFENVGIRMGTIPIEDAIYSLLLLLMNVSIYEGFKSKSRHVVLTGVVHTPDKAGK